MMMVQCSGRERTLDFGSLTRGIQSMTGRIFSFTAERKREAQRVLARCAEPREALLPLLWLVQEQEGFVPADAERFVADALGISRAEVHEAVSFSARFRDAPGALHTIRLCTGLCCHMKGARGILRHIEGRLGVSAGGTTEEGRFGLATADCLGACDGAPAMMVDERRYEGVTVEQVDELLRELGAKF